MLRTRQSDLSQDLNRETWRPFMRSTSSWSPAQWAEVIPYFLPLCFPLVTDRSRLLRLDSLQKVLCEADFAILTDSCALSQGETEVTEPRWAEAHSFCLTLNALDQMVFESPFRGAHERWSAQQRGDSECWLFIFTPPIFFFKPQVEKVDIEDRRGYFSSSKANCI